MTDQISIPHTRFEHSLIFRIMQGSSRPRRSAFCIHLLLLRLRHSSSGYSLASHRCGPGFETGSSCGILWWTKWRRGRFPPSTSVSPAKSIPPIAPKNHLHHHHHHQSVIGDMYNRPNGQTSMAVVQEPNRYLGT
jgi:hypothetical protein